MESFGIPEGTKAEKYESVFQQWTGLMEGESDTIVRMANTAALLKVCFGWWWVGFYRVMNDELLLGPFQGPPACTRIKTGKGVCGTSWEQRKTIVVPDVDLFPGHIACSAASRSEIVVPIIRNETVIAILDADSEHLNHFDETDVFWLEKIAKSI